VVQFIGRLSEKAQVQDLDGVLAMVKLPDSSLPVTVSEAVPSLPRTKPLTTAMLLAANLRSLFWRNGEGYNEVCKALDIPKSAIYCILRGDRQTKDTVQKLAAYFGVTQEYLEDPESPRYNIELVVDNVKWLAGRDGMRALPGGAKAAQVVNNAELPHGKLLRSLAEHVGVELKVFLSEDLSLRADIQKDPLSVAVENRPAAKENLAENLKLELLLKGLSRTQAAWRMPMRANQFDNYASGRQFPPPENLEKMAVFFGTTPLALLAEPRVINVAEVSRNITAGFNSKAVAVWVAAQRIGIAPLKLEHVLSGEELPSGPQLHAIARYLGLTPRFLLGLERPSDDKGIELPKAA
jgi:transcriptional regulator with XRE-family HTH domain